MNHMKNQISALSDPFSSLNNLLRNWLGVRGSWLKYLLIIPPMLLAVLHVFCQIICLHSHSSGNQGSSRGPQPFYHQGLVSWKTIFPQPEEEDGFGMIQEHYIYCALYFYYYYISSASDHQALDPRGWGALVYGLYYFKGCSFRLMVTKGESKGRVGEREIRNLCLTYTHYYI